MNPIRLPYRFVGSFKGILFVLAIGIILAVQIYTERMVSDLRQNSRRQLTLEVDRYRLLFMQDDDEALDAYLKGMATKDFPLIVADASRRPVSWSGIPLLDRLSTEEAAEKAVELQQEWIRQGNDPISIEIPEFGLVNYFYYGDSEYIRRLRFMPWIEIAVVGGLILIGYLGFLNIKKSEERSVWVGMARETAHQLGTPLTSLYGWYELLGERPGDPETRAEMKHDLERLTIVAERFNQIGSHTKLKTVQAHELIEEASNYIKRRLPRAGKGSVRIDVNIPSDLTLNANPTLLGWVIENLLKNGIEALRGKSGSVEIRGYSKANKVILDITDNGCGIPHREWRNVFRPGFSTKGRGWGLGLSLARRIIEDVHKGKIGVFDSSPEKGTVIQIQFPR